MTVAGRSHYRTSLWSGASVILIPWKRPEFFLIGAIFVVLAVLMFVKDPSTARVLVVLVCVLFAAAIVLMIKGLVDMVRMVRRTRANNPSRPS